MKGEELLDLLGYLDEDLIMESAGFGEAGRKTLNSHARTLGTTINETV